MNVVSNVPENFSAHMMILRNGKVVNKKLILPVLNDEVGVDAKWVELIEGELTKLNLVAEDVVKFEGAVVHKGARLLFEGADLATVMPGELDIKLLAKTFAAWTMARYLARVLNKPYLIEAVATELELMDTKN